MDPRKMTDDEITQKLYEIAHSKGRSVSNPVPLDKEELAIVNESSRRKAGELVSYALSNPGAIVHDE